MVTVGATKYTYEVIESWGVLPEGWTFGNVGTVAVDSQDRVYAFQRKDPPMLVFDREGNFLNSWGNGAMVMAHGLYIGPDDMVYLTDTGDHVTMKYTLDGKPLLILGNRGQPSDTGCEEAGGKVLRPGGPFNMPAQMVSSPSGELYVADGYRNCRIHRFTSQGRLIASWGNPGKVAPGEFHAPHCVWVDKEGTVFVCDRDKTAGSRFSQPQGSSWPCGLRTFTGPHPSTSTLRRPCTSPSFPPRETTPRGAARSAFGTSRATT